MGKQDNPIAPYLSDIQPDFAGDVLAIHQLLVDKGCTVKLQQAKSGHVVSYNHPATKKVVANLVSRKAGPVIRVYADNAGKYPAFLDTMPEPLEQLVAKAPDCRRMLDPTKCNARCPMGYDFAVNGQRYQKCRYGGFLFPVKRESVEWIIELLTKEIANRIG